jgi:hypothetical protein
MTSRSHTRDTSVNFSRPCTQKEKLGEDGRPRPPAGDHRTLTETKTAKKARVSRETKDLHAEEERVASAEKKK